MSDKPELTYADLQIGKEFEPFHFSIDKMTVGNFLMAIEENASPLYQDISIAQQWGYNRPLAPHSLAAVYGRSSYLKNYTMPGGGILAKQDFQFFHPVFVGDQLVCRSRVTDRFVKKGRNYVIIEIDSHNQDGQQISLIRIEAIWPK